MFFVWVMDHWREGQRGEKTRGQGNNESSLCHPMYAWMTIELKGIVRCRYYVVIVVIDVIVLFCIGVIKGGWVEHSGRETEKKREEEERRGNIADDLWIHVLC